jgi:hypothetical protein
LKIKTPGFVFNNSIKTSRPPVYSTIRVVSAGAAATGGGIGGIGGVAILSVGFISFLI